MKIATRINDIIALASQMSDPGAGVPLIEQAATRREKGVDSDAATRPLEASEKTATPPR